MTRSWSWATRSTTRDSDSSVPASLACGQRSTVLTKLSWLSSFAPAFSPDEPVWFAIAPSFIPRSSAPWTFEPSADRVCDLARRIFRRMMPGHAKRLDGKVRHRALRPVEDRGRVAHCIALERQQQLRRLRRRREPLGVARDDRHPFRGLALDR